MLVLKDVEELRGEFREMDRIYRQREIWVIMKASRHKKPRNRPSAFISGFRHQNFHRAFQG